MIDQPEFHLQKDLILHPGDLIFSQAPTRLRTVLGSCVALTVWHPTLKVGGMCHFLLPQYNDSQDQKTDRFGDVALKNMSLKMMSYAGLQEYELGLFGGAKLIYHKDDTASVSVGALNVLQAHAWLKELDLKLKHEHTGNIWSRTIILDLNDGSILLKKVSSDQQQDKRGQ